MRMRRWGQSKPSQLALGCRGRCDRGAPRAASYSGRHRYDGGPATKTVLASAPDRTSSCGIASPGSPDSLS